jgi:hypothetical protein
MRLLAASVCGRDTEAARSILPHPFVVQVTLAKQDGLRGAQGGVAQACVEGFQVRSAVAEPADGDRRFRAWAGQDLTGFLDQEF